jgi:hypothetical protein
MKIHWGTTDVHGTPIPTFELDRQEREAVLYALGWSLDDETIHQATMKKVFKTMTEIDAAIKAMEAVARLERD